MRIFIISEDVFHTRRWILSLANKGFKVFLFSIGRLKNDNLYSINNNIQTFSCEDFFNVQFITRKTYLKYKYLRILPILKRKICEFSPDIVHSHYATSNGILGVLSGFRPLIISVWGSDVYNFPKKNVFCKLIFKYILSNATCILSTSNAMATEIKKYTNKEILVTPFGVDTTLFYRKSEIDRNKTPFIIGNVKALESIYAIDVLLKAFSIFYKNNNNPLIRLDVIGDGSEKIRLIRLAKELGVKEQVRFLGVIDNSELVDYYNYFSVFVTLSHKESFGVVALEAMSCECPVIASNADGYVEIIQNNVSGIIVEKNNPMAAAEAMQKMYDNASMRERIGKAGRKIVLNKYNWCDNVNLMIEIYKTIYDENNSFT